MTEEIHINDLPMEIFAEILKYIDGNSLGRCLSVCRQWKDYIDDRLWRQMCINEFKYSSQIAKKKSGNDCSWYHIFRNLKKWSDLKEFERNIYPYREFKTNSRYHMLGIDNGLLPLKDSSGIVLLDMHTSENLPLVLPHENCLRIVNTDDLTILQTQTGLLIQRTIDSDDFVAEEFFEADNFVLSNNILYYYCNKYVYKCDMKAQKFIPKLLFKCANNIKDIQHSNYELCIFTVCGHIITVNKKNLVTIKSINCPKEWVRHLKNLSAFDDKNFVYYSQNIFKIETEKHKHLYLEFPPVTAVFFYINDVIIGILSGEILLYRLSNQVNRKHPMFEVLTHLPNGRYAVQIDVCERKTGPTIAISTFFELFLYDVKFNYPETKIEPTELRNKQPMYDRLLKLKSRLENI